MSSDRRWFNVLPNSTTLVILDEADRRARLDVYAAADIGLTWSDSDTAGGVAVCQWEDATRRVTNARIPPDARGLGLVNGSASPILVYLTICRRPLD